jgi:hypothetical protein
MKRYILFVGMVGCLVLNTCGSESTRLNFVFGRQPEGGEDVSVVDCVIVGQLVDGDTPIQVTIQWLWENLDHQNQQLYLQDTWTFRSQTAEEIPTGVQAPSGYILVGYFWFRADWEDEDGTPNTVVSDTARCTSSLDQSLHVLDMTKRDQLETFLFPAN